MNITIDRDLLIKQMYDGGATLQSIAELIGKTRQFVLIVAKRNSDGQIRYRRITKSNPRRSEIWVKEHLDELGIESKFCTYTEECDLRVGDKRVEIKHRSKATKRGNHYYYSFSGLYKKNADIFVLLTGGIENPKCYIYKSEELTSTSKTIPKIIRYGSKSLMFEERWEKISQV